MKRILVLGGGSAGVMFSNRMRREFGQDELEIVVIEKSEKHIYQPAFTLVVFDLDDPKNLVRPTKDLFFDGIKLVIDEVTKIHPEENKVTTTKNGDYSYDYLVIATGGRLVYGEPEGMKEGLEKGTNLFTFYNMDGAVKLRDALKNFDGGTIASTVCEMPIKCPAAPMKFIMMAEDMSRRMGIRDKCKFVFTTPMPAVFSRQPYASKLESIFKARGIETVPNFTPSEVDHDKGIIKDFGGKEVKFDLMSITPPHEGMSLIENSEGVGDAANWVTCDKHRMVSKKFENIYGIGDATDFPTSKTASGIRKQAKVLVSIFKAILKGEAPTATYDGEIICPMLTRYNRVMFAHFNYEEAISPAIESYANWVLKVHMLRPLYFNLMLNGLV
ncbi:NAD(FAD)-dependent dehydrogenase [Candidatus Omnitrophus magneticus]|uniref:NAD(FAD)-dependent dehydrogenase n=1 Tax=Candidatus Omnitrophus magneticus TaxID=1609969 RepID=A0A0F0CQ54_9BACT|nr:NAD(FAD)-dependent dehydrogenase [Candidatus Omnitrophus magneticus]